MLCYQKSILKFQNQFNYPKKSILTILRGRDMKECIYFKKFEVKNNAKLAMKRKKNVFRIRFLKKIS